MRRAGGVRCALAVLACAVVSAAAAAAGGYVDYPPVVPGHAVELPADYGSHPAFRTEWWYVTGWLDADGGRTFGFQVTFFRTRPDVPPGNPSAFAPNQLIIAHVAVSDPGLGHLLHDQRIARDAYGLAGASPSDTRVWIGDWVLQREGDRYRTRIAADGFSLDLWLRVTQPPLVNGVHGYSRKGPDPASASDYYSEPQLEVSGRLARGARVLEVRGSAWLDHEWSTALLDARAAGWDWFGINLDDGGALMAFCMRSRDGSRLWAGGTLRRPGAAAVSFGPGEVECIPGRRWRSPRTGIEYPVTWRLRAGALALDVIPLMDDQESDSRLTTGAVYWEGAVRALQAGKPVGRGYLELTGYGGPLRLPGDGGG